MSTQQYLVLGATGGQGRAVINALIEQHASVRALVRNPQSESAQQLLSLEVEVVTGWLDDQDSLTIAMTDVDGCFAITTPFEQGTSQEIAQGRAIIGAARRAELPHLLFSSVASASMHSGVPHFESKAVIEQELQNTDLVYTILGPTYFYDNVLGSIAGLLAGELTLPLPADRPLQQLDRDDYGKFAAKVLFNPTAYIRQRIDVASDEVTPNQMKDALAANLGSPVTYQQMPLEDISNPDMHAMWKFLVETGYSVDIQKLHIENPEILWHSYSAWVKSALATFV